MLSYEIYNYYSFINNKLDEIEEVFKVIFNWREKYTDCYEKILNKILVARTSTAGNDTHYIVPNGGVIKNFDDIMEELQKTFNAITVTIRYGEIKKEIETYKKKMK